MESSTGWHHSPLPFPARGAVLDRAFTTTPPDPLPLRRRPLFFVGEGVALDLLLVFPERAPTADSAF